MVVDVLLRLILLVGLDVEDTYPVHERPGGQNGLDTSLDRLRRGTDDRKFHVRLP